MANFQTKNPKLSFFWGTFNGICWYIFGPFGLFYSNLVYFVATWHMLWLFGIFFPGLVCCTEKNLSYLVCRVLGCYILEEIFDQICTYLLYWLRLILFHFSEDRKIVPNLVLTRAQLINMEQDCLYKLGEEAIWDKARATKWVCKNCPKCSQITFCKNKYVHNFNRWK
jgi:hypothetical protein